MRELQLSVETNLIARADSITGCRPLANAIEREDCGLRKWRGKKGGSRICFVVLSEENLGSGGREGLADFATNV